MFDLVDPGAIDAQSFRRAMQHIQTAIDRGGANERLSDIAEAIVAGTMQLWTTERSAAVTAVVTITRPIGPPQSVCQVLYIAGDMEEALAFEEQISAAATGIGCVRLEGAGRTGWGRALRDRGWRPTGSVYKELGGV